LGLSVTQLRAFSRERFRTGLTLKTKIIVEVSQHLQSMKIVCGPQGFLKDCLCGLSHQLLLTCHVFMLSFAVLPRWTRHLFLNNHLQFTSQCHDSLLSQSHQVSPDFFDEHDHSTYISFTHCVHVLVLATLRSSLEFGISLGGCATQTSRNSRHSASRILGLVWEFMYDSGRPEADYFGGPGGRSPQVGGAHWSTKRIPMEPRRRPGEPK